jgi:tetratricopeptide (TPR) repeat protein
MALQVELEPRNARQSFQEMSVLCHELLSSALPKSGRNKTIERFAQAVMTGLVNRWNQPSQQVIECLREANVRLPDSHFISFVLLRSFNLRFWMTKSIGDYENAMAVFDKIVAPHSSIDSPSPYLGDVLKTAARLLQIRFTFYGNPEYLEEAIFRCRAILSLIPPEDPNHGDIIQILIKLEKHRFDEFGVTNGLPEAPSSNPKDIDLPLFSDLSASLSESDNPKLMERLRYLRAVKAMCRITDKAEIEDAVKYCRRLLTLLQQSPDDAMTLTHLIINESAGFLLRAFELTRNPEHLNESIDLHQGILRTPRAHCIHSEVIPRLILSLLSRIELSKDRKDVDEVMRLYHIIVTDIYAKISTRFQMSCQWARMARLSGHPSTLTAYDNAISLMQDALTLAPTLDIQHFRLVAMRDKIEGLPVDYASYQIRMGRLKQAIEILERGRGLLWSEIRGFRASIDRLRAVNSHLAEKFTAVNWDLEDLTMSGSPGVWMDGGPGRVDGGEEIDPFGRIVLKQRKLLDERNSLITQIRSLPGFEDFLMGPSFDTLRSVASHGPVVIINHCRWRSDIIILFHNTHPSLIPTSEDFYDRAKGLKERLFAARKKGLDSPEYDDALGSVLKTLYDLVGRPVIQRLKKLNVPEQSRIWWCPTSVFCSLPLHAMGPVRSDGPFKLYFSDLYIPSYIRKMSHLLFLLFHYFSYFFAKK